MAFIKVPLIEEKLDINVRVYNLTLTSFLAEIMENYIVELEDHVKESGLHVKKNKFHCNELKRNIRMWINHRYMEVGREYRDFLTTQLDDLYDDMRHDYTVFFYSVKRFFDKRIDDSNETTTLALLVLIISMASYFQIKEEDFSKYVSEQFECHYVMKSNYISNIARHATMFLNSFKHDDIELVVENEPDIQAAWDILDYKLSHVKINLVDDIK